MLFLFNLLNPVFLDQLIHTCVKLNSLPVAVEFDFNIFAIVLADQFFELGLVVVVCGLLEILEQFLIRELFLVH